MKYMPYRNMELYNQFKAQGTSLNIDMPRGP